MSQPQFHALGEEPRRLRQVVDFYWSIRNRRGPRAVDTQVAMVGGFEKAWTLAEDASA